MNNCLSRIVLASFLGISVAIHAQPAINNEIAQQGLVKVFNAVVNPSEEIVLLDSVMIKSILNDLNLTKLNLEALHKALELLNRAVALLPLAYQESVASTQEWKKLLDDLSTHRVTEQEFEVLVQQLLDSPQFENFRNVSLLLDNISVLVADIEEIVNVAGYFAQEIQDLVNQLDVQGLPTEQIAQIIDNSVNIMQPNISILQSIINEMLETK